MAISADSAGLPPPSEGMEHVRHAGIDRAFHWLTAISVLTLMTTGLLPHVGVQFDWLAVHWITGLVLTALTVFHVLRALVWQRFRVIWFSGADFRHHSRSKYSLAQKLMHLAMGLMVLAAVCTGLLMLKRIATPLLTRNPYLLAPGTWGVVYAIHGLAAISAVTLVIVHIYFALIPENRRYLKAMITGRCARP